MVDIFALSTSRVINLRFYSTRRSVEGRRGGEICDWIVAKRMTKEHDSLEQIAGGNPSKTKAFNKNDKKNTLEINDFSKIY